MAETDRPIPDLLAIGIATGGMSPANQLVDEALSGFMRTVMKERSAFPNEGVRLNIVFHIPGPISQPDYEGIHATKFDKKNQRVLVVAAVPESLKFDEVSKYFVEVLRQARHEVTGYLAKRKVTTPTNQLDGLIDHLLNQIEVGAP
jgi:hypothetical protein